MQVLPPIARCRSLKLRAPRLGPPARSIALRCSFQLLTVIDRPPRRLPLQAQPHRRRRRLSPVPPTWRL